MELGLEFDDDDLKSEVISSKPQQTLESYHVKVCTPLWFDDNQRIQLNSKPTADTLDELLSLKFSGDYHYHKKEYDVAAMKYEEALELLQPNASATKLDISQSLARCYLYKGKTEEAIQILNSLIRSAQNFDQQRQCLSLQYQFHVFMHDWSGTISVLHKLITMEPLYIQYWIQLAEAYCNSQDTRTTDELTVKLITCYIRARLLLRSVHHYVGPFVQVRDDNLLADINQKISKLAVTELQIEKATEFLSRDVGSDFENDLNDEKQEPLKSVIATEEESFESRWFLWSHTACDLFSDSRGIIT